jgi:hypothetical protein
MRCYRSGQYSAATLSPCSAGQTTLLYYFKNKSEELSLDSETAENHQVNPDESSRQKQPAMRHS